MALTLYDPIWHVTLRAACVMGYVPLTAIHYLYQFTFTFVCVLLFNVPVFLSTPGYDAHMCYNTGKMGRTLFLRQHRTVFDLDADVTATLSDEFWERHDGVMSALTHMNHQC